MPRGLLFSQMEPPEAMEQEFHEWYDDEHIPVRLALDGFVTALRFRAIEGTPKYLAVYHLSDLAALDTSAYRRVKDHASARTERMLGAVRGFTRYTCEEIYDSGGAARPGSYMSVVAFAAPDGEEAARLDEWYETEHIPRLLEADDWLRVRRYRVLSGTGAWTHLALHELASVDVMQSPERAAARRGPKRDALADRPWFRDSGRWLYELMPSARSGAADVAP